MATWSNYISLFPEAQQSVIESLQSLVSNSLSIDSYEDFESNFSSASVSFFEDLLASNDFVIDLTTWLKNKASSASDWNDFSSSFNSNDETYVSQVVSAYEGSTVEDFAEELAETTASTIIAIEGFWSNYQNSLSLYIQDLVDLLEITVQPVDQDVCHGVDVTFSITADGEDPLSYQWRKDGQNLDNGTSAQLSINNVTENDEGSYDCVVSTPSGLSRTTSAASLSVKERIIITEQPSSKEIEWNSNHQLLVNASGEGPLSYQWRKNGKAISGETTNELTLSNASTKDNGAYDCVVSNVCEELVSNKANITVVSFSSEVLLVYGKVTSEKEVPQSNITVKVLDKKPGASKELGTAVTDSKGTYQIEYLQSDLYNQEEGIPNLIVQLIADGETEPKVTSDLIEKASVKEEVNFTTDSFLDSSTEFSQIDTYLSNTLEPEVNLNELDQDDIKLLVSKAFDQESIQAYINAANLNSEISVVSQENFYGLMKQGLSPKIEILVQENESSIKDALYNSFELNLISNIDETSVNNTINSLKSVAPNVIEGSSLNPFKKAFEIVSLTNEQKQGIVEAFLNDSPEGSNRWETLTDPNTGIITSAEEANIKRVLSIQEIEPSNEAFIEIIDEKVGSSSTPTTMNELANLDQSDWELLIDDLDPELLTIPNRFTGTDVEKKSAYAKDLMISLELKAPSTVVFARMKNDTSFDSIDYEEFQNEYPNFDFAKTQVGKVVAETPMSSANFTNTIEDVQSNLEAAQRVFRLMPKLNKFENMKPLLTNGLTSSQKIVRMGKVDFVNTVNNDVSQEDAVAIFNNAAETNAKVVHLAGKYKNYRSPFVIGNEFNPNSTQVDGLPNLDNLFGSLDYCSCKQCSSIYSPAAYMVDLIKFLDHEPVLNDNTSLGYNLSDKLFERRGEIKDLLLNCDNTNIPLPQIDIVNELLENKISDSSIVYQTLHDSIVLKATPQNRINSVYDVTLKNAVYPNSMPFNLSFQEAIEYTKEMGVNYGEFLEAMPINISEARAAAIAMGIPSAQFDIIIGNNALTIRQLYNVDLEELLTESEYLSQIVNPISTFLSKAQISFELFEQLLSSKYINPTQKKIYYPSDGSCNLEIMTLGNDSNPAEGFDPIELNRLNRFIRLISLTDWNIKDLDLVINSLGNVSGDPLDSNLILNLYQLNSLKDRFNLEIEEIVTWWADFNIASYIDKSLFNKLFRNVTVNHENDQPIYDLESLIGNPLPSKEIVDIDIKPLVLGATNLNAEELDYILDKGEINREVSVPNLSYLFRLSSFIKALNLSIDEFYTKKDILNIEPISLAVSRLPSHTIEFLEKVEDIESSPFSYDEIEYLRHGDYSSTFSINENQITEALEGFRNIYNQNPIQLPLIAEDLDAEFENLVVLYFGNNDRAFIDGVINGAEMVDESNEQAVLEHLGKFILSDELSTLYLDMGYANSSSQRKAILYSFLQRYFLFQEKLIPSISEELSLIYDIPAEFTTQFLSLKLPITSIQSFGDKLTSLEFLSNNDEINSQNYSFTYVYFELSNKLALIIKRLNLNQNEVEYFLNKMPSSWLQIEEIPSYSGAPTITYTELENILTLRNLDKSIFKNELSLIEFLNIQSNENRFEKLSEATSWSVNEIEILCSSNGFDFIATPSVFEDVNWFKKLNQSISYLGKINLDADIVLNQSLLSPNTSTSFTFRNALKSLYGNESWNNIAKKVHDPIRILKRDAMVSYLIAHYSEFSNKSEIFDYFLIDTQISPCQLTSRVKQSISALQLFIQRIALGKEGDAFLDEEKMEEWSWYKNYRVWEANRKVFLYPENYLLPELRLNSSKLYKDFEETLSLQEMNDGSVEAAYEKYIVGFKEINNIEVQQLCYDKKTDTLHLIGSDKQEPQQFYHRTQINRSFWTPWELIPLKIKGEVLPIIHRSKLMLVWFDTKVNKQSPSAPDLSYSPSPDANGNYPTISTNEQSVKADTELRLAWTTKGELGWEEVKLSNQKFMEQDLDLDSLIMFPMYRDDSTLFLSVNKKGDENSSYDVEQLYAFKYALGDFIPVNIGGIPEFGVVGDLDSQFVNYTQLNKVNNRQPSNNPANPDFKIWTVGRYYIKPQYDPFNNTWMEMEEYYMDLDYNSKRSLNLATLGPETYNENSTIDYKNQKINLAQITSLNVTHEVITDELYQLHNREYNNNFEVIKEEKVGVRYSNLLRHFSTRDIKLIRQITEEFPLIADDSLVTGEKLSPFLMIDSSRCYVVYPEDHEIAGTPPSLITKWIEQVGNPSRLLYTKLLTGQDLE